MIKGILSAVLIQASAYVGFLVYDFAGAAFGIALACFITAGLET